MMSDLDNKFGDERHVHGTIDDNTWGMAHLMMRKHVEYFVLCTVGCLHAY